MIFLGVCHNATLPLTHCSNAPAEPENKPKPLELGLAGITVLPTLQQLMGGWKLSTLPAPLLTSGRVYLSHTSAPTIQVNVVVKWQVLTSKLNL